MQSRAYVVCTSKTAPDVRLVESMTLNGGAPPEPWLTYGHVVAGGELVVTSSGT